MIILLGCAGQKESLAQLDDEQVYKRAEAYYQDGKYQKAITTLNELRYTPSVWADDAHLLTAKAYIADDEPILAASELKWLIKQYSQSKLVQEASFLLAEAYRLAAPKPQLDQEYTKKAIQAYNDFLDLYPMSELADSAKYGKQLCLEKLAHKQYLSAELYYKINQDSSAVVYINDIREKYPNTLWRLWSDLLEAKIRLDQNNQQRARILLNQILVSNPDNKLEKKARDLLKELE